MLILYLSSVLLADWPKTVAVQQKFCDAGLDSGESAAIISSHR